MIRKDDFNMNNTQSVLPFSMHFVDMTTASERGYELEAEARIYDPLLQVAPFSMNGGETSPTTYSMTGTTGLFNTDSDEDTDDTGKD